MASTGAHYPQTKGLPLKICKEMIEWGYEKYERDHTILVGWTEEYVKSHPEKIENYLKVRMHNLCPVEFYLRHLLARQSHDTSQRLKDIKQPTLILVGDGRPEHDQRDQSPNVIGNLGQWNPQFQARRATQRAA